MLFLLGSAGGWSDAQAKMMQTCDPPAGARAKARGEAAPARGGPGAAEDHHLGMLRLGTSVQLQAEAKRLARKKQLEEDVLPTFNCCVSGCPWEFRPAHLRRGQSVIPGSSFQRSSRPRKRSRTERSFGLLCACSVSGTRASSTLIRLQQHETQEKKAKA